MKLQGLKTIQKYLFLPILLTFLLIRVLHAETNVSGNITTDTAWTLANSPYIVTGTIQVLEGATLTMEPGVTVKFDKDTLLRIGGKLIAEGTETQMITFTSNEPTPASGDWGPIEFVEDAVGSTLDEDGEYISGSIIKYCQIKNGYGILSKVGLYISDNIATNISYIRGEIGIYALKNNVVAGGSEVSFTGEAIIEDNTFNSGSIEVRGTVATILRNSTLREINVRGERDGIFKITGNAVTISNGAGVICSGSGTFEITENTVSDGEGITCTGSGAFNIINNTIRNNYGSHIESGPTYVWVQGGGIYISSESFLISDNTITENKINVYSTQEFDQNNFSSIKNISMGEQFESGYGGGIYALGSGTIKNNIITNNIAAGYIGSGGGIYFKGRAVDIFNNTITDNNGGGLFIRSEENSQGMINIYGNAITENISRGAISIDADGKKNSINIYNNTITKNSYQGIKIEDSANLDITILDNIIKKNNGGVISNEGKSVTISKNTITDNFGNGIYGTGEIEENIVIRNSGIGIFCDTGTISGNIVTGNSRTGIACNSSIVTKNTITYNLEDGIYIRAAGTNTITGNTITNNSGNGIYIRVGPATILGNNLNDNEGEYIVYNNGSENITATNNWWGTNDVSEVEEMIYDYYDDITRGKVIFEPIARFAFPATGFTPISISTTWKPEHAGTYRLGFFIINSSGDFETIEMPEHYVVDEGQ